MSEPASKKNNASHAGHALVTGGSAGLGLAVARACRRRGMLVTIAARDPERLAEAALAVSENGGAVSATGAPPTPRVRTAVADLAFSGEPTRVVEEANAVAPLDLVCHAAGASARGRITETPRAEFERLMALNFFAAAELATASAERLADRKGGLVLIGSLATRVAPSFLGAYPTSKHPLAALAQQLRLEMGPRGLRTLLVCPGPIARPDAGKRYNGQAGSLPPSARQPGGGAKVRAIDPDWLAERILSAAARGRRELVVPSKARLLFTLGQISPRLGDWLLGRFMKS